MHVILSILIVATQHECYDYMKMSLNLISQYMCIKQVFLLEKNFFMRRHVACTIHSLAITLPFSLSKNCGNDPLTRVTFVNIIQTLK